MPTRGQALFIFYLIAINIVLSCVGINVTSPDAWYDSRSAAVLVYVTNRQGVLSFANIPLLILYSSRNNALLWLTNWSHSTFLLIHRWIAILCTIEACLHSAIYLQIYVSNGTHAEESALPYWIWGIIATLALSILLPASILPLRKRLYELFLATHFVVAFLAVLGCYLHIFYRFEHQWGYETWIYIAFAIWAFDRLLMRFLRMARNGIRTAKITVLDNEYIRIDIAGISAQGHAYLYFPTMSWRVLENHPFSVVQNLPVRPCSVLEQPSEFNSCSAERIDKLGLAKDVESPSPQSEDGTQDSGPTFGRGVSFFVRTTNGLSARLRQRSTLPVLVESSYGESLAAPHSINAPNVILIGGGVGVTALLPHIRHTPGRTRLFWSSRSQALVDTIKETLGRSVLTSQVVGKISINRRLDLRKILNQEVVDETIVIVCGPASMADEVRNLVCEIGQEGRKVVQLIDESFSW